MRDTNTPSPAALLASLIRTSGGDVDPALASTMVDTAIREGAEPLLLEALGWKSLPRECATAIRDVASPKLVAAYLRRSDVPVDEIVATAKKEKRSTVLTAIAETEGLGGDVYRAIAGRGIGCDVKIVSNPDAPVDLCVEITKSLNWPHLADRFARELFSSLNQRLELQPELFDHIADTWRLEGRSSWKQDVFQSDPTLTAMVADGTVARSEVMASAAFMRLGAWRNLRPEHLDRLSNTARVVLHAAEAFIAEHNVVGWNRQRAVSEVNAMWRLLVEHPRVRLVDLDGLATATVDLFESDTRKRYTKALDRLRSLAADTLDPIVLVDSASSEELIEAVAAERVVVDVEFVKLVLSSESFGEDVRDALFAASNDEEVHKLLAQHSDTVFEQLRRNAVHHVSVSRWSYHTTPSPQGLDTVADIEAFLDALEEYPASVRKVFARSVATAIEKLDDVPAATIGRLPWATVLDAMDRYSWEKVNAGVRALLAEAAEDRERTEFYALFASFAANSPEMATAEVIDVATRLT